MAPITINEDAKRAANLRVLQRMDNRIVDIIGSATHVVLYEFNVTDKAWEKRNCEGSLFIVKRSDVPRFNLVVMNRSSKENLVVNITSAFQMQVREPYLIFRLEKKSNSNNSKTVANEKIRGIWFHDADERSSISSILDRIVKTVATYIDDEEEEQNAENRTKTVSHSEATASLLSALNINKTNNSENTTSSENNKNNTASQVRVDQGEKELLNNIELDKKSLQLSLMSLLQDERFLDLIHAQYIKVVRARKQG